MHDYLLCKRFIIVHDGDIWLRVTQRSLLDQLRSLWGGEAQKKWSLQFAVNIASSRSSAEVAHCGEHRGSNFLRRQISFCEAVCMCLVVFYVCDTATESVFICMNMFVPFNACGGALVTPCNRQLLQGQIEPKTEVEQLLLVAWIALFVCFLLLWAEEALSIFKLRLNCSNSIWTLTFYSLLFLATLHCAPYLYLLALKAVVR